MYEELPSDHSELQWLRPSLTPGSFVFKDGFPVEMQSYLAMEVFPSEDETRVWKCILNVGTFSRAQAASFVNLLKQIGQDKAIYYYYDNKSICALKDSETPARNELFFRGTLDDLLKIYEHPFTDCCPTIWWPADRSWFMMNFVDLPMGVFAGSAETVQQLKACLPWRHHDLDKDSSTGPEHLGLFVNPNRSWSAKILV